MLPHSHHYTHTQLRQAAADSPFSLQKSDFREIFINQLSEFFDSFSPTEFSKKLSVILQAYSANDYYRQSSPSDVIFVMEKLFDLVTTAHCLYLYPSQRNQSAMNVGGIDLSYMSTHIRESITGFFHHQKLQEWQDTIRHITFFALCKDSPADAGYQNDTLFLFNAFSNMVNACYLVFEQLNNDGVRDPE